MKALVCNSFGPIDQLSIQDLPDPSPAADEILIKVKACGVNFPDVLIVQGKYQFKPEFPFSPGGEIAGVVEKVGSEVEQFEEGDEVFALTGWGGFAEKVALKTNVCIPKHIAMDFRQAAAFTMVYGTSFHALKDRAKLREGESLLVLGAAGGVGLTAVELGKKMGAKVIAAASTDEKLLKCKEYGADELINYTQVKDLKNHLKEITKGKGVDVIYDPVGGPFTEAALRAIAWKGRYLVIGFASGEIPKIPLNLPLLKGCSIQGVFWGSFAQREAGKNLTNMMQLIQWFAEEELKPYIHKVFSLEEGIEALQMLEHRKAIGKLVIEP